MSGATDVAAPSERHPGQKRLMDRTGDWFLSFLRFPDINGNVRKNSGWPRRGPTTTRERVFQFPLGRRAGLRELPSKEGVHRNQRTRTGLRS